VQYLEIYLKEVRGYENFNEIVGYPVQELKRESSEHEYELSTDFTLRHMLTTQTIH